MHPLRVTDDSGGAPGTVASVGPMLTWLGHAGVVVADGPTTLVIDPWFSAHPDRLVAPPSIADLPSDTSYLMATHEHLDHLDLPALGAVLDRCPGVKFVVPEPLADMTQQAVGQNATVIGVRPGQCFNVGPGCAVLATPAWHAIEVRDGYSDGGWSASRSEPLRSLCGEPARLQALPLGRHDRVSGSRRFPAPAQN